MSDSIDAKWDKLMVMMERLASQPPTVNVNVNLSDGKKKRQVISNPDNPPEFPEPGGHPRPYVS